MLYVLTNNHHVILSLGWGFEKWFDEAVKVLNAGIDLAVVLQELRNNPRIGDQYTIKHVHGETVVQISEVVTAPKSTKITGVRLTSIVDGGNGRYYTLSHFKALVADGKLIAR